MNMKAMEALIRSIQAVQIAQSVVLSHLLAASPAAHQSLGKAAVTVGDLGIALQLSDLQLKTIEDTLEAFLSAARPQ